MTRDLEKRFPHGHKRFIPILLDLMQLHSDKNHDYASGGDPLGNFKRVAALLAQYPGLDLGNPMVVALVYALKQVDAVLWSLAQDITAKVEGRGKRLDDVANYAVLAKILDEEDQAPVELVYQGWCSGCGPYRSHVPHKCVDKVPPVRPDDGPSGCEGTD